MKKREKMKGKMKEKMKRDKDERKEFFFKVSRPSNPPDELGQHVSKKKKKKTVGRIIHPFFFESSESDRVFNYLHDSNSIFRAG